MNEEVCEEGLLAPEQKRKWERYFGATGMSCTWKPWPSYLYQWSVSNQAHLPKIAKQIDLAWCIYRSSIRYLTRNCRTIDRSYMYSEIANRLFIRMDTLSCKTIIDGTNHGIGALFLLLLWLDDALLYSYAARRKGVVVAVYSWYAPRRERLVYGSPKLDCFIANAHCCSSRVVVMGKKGISALCLDTCWDYICWNQSPLGMKLFWLEEQLQISSRRDMILKTKDMKSISLCFWLPRKAGGETGINCDVRCVCVMCVMVWD